MGLLSAIGNLLGARAESKQRKLENYMNSPQGIRTEFEKWGFNPLLGMTNYNFGRSAGSVGDKIARAGVSYDEATDRETALEIQKSELELEKDRLEKLVEKRTLSANVPGIYGQRRAKANGQANQRGRTGGPAGQANQGGGRGGNGAVLGGDTGGFDSTVENEKAGKMKWFGWDVVPTGTTSSGQTAEDNMGDLGGSAWGLVANIPDYVVGTARHHIPSLTPPKGTFDAMSPEEFKKRMKAAEEKRRKRKQKIRNGYQPNGAYEWPRGVGRMNQTLYP